MKLTYKTIHMLTIEVPLALPTDRNDADFHKRLTDAKAKLILLGYAFVGSSVEGEIFCINGHKVTQP